MQLHNCHMPRILILGGTRFLGRHIAKQALAAGHQVTLLHRGVSNAGLFPHAQHLIVDRDGDDFAAQLQGQTWDTVIDTSAYLPRQVRRVAAALAGRVGSTSWCRPSAPTRTLRPRAQPKLQRCTRWTTRPPKPLTAAPTAA